MARLPRPHMSLSVKLAACLDALGFKPDDVIEWDHTWALGLRERTQDGGYIPAANDPRYIRPKVKDGHAVKTRGNGATTAGSDVGRIAKVRRIIRKREAEKAQLPQSVGIAMGRAIQKRAKRKIQSRPFGPSRKFSEQWR